MEYLSFTQPGFRDLDAEGSMTNMARSGRIRRRAAWLLGGLLAVSAGGAVLPWAFARSDRIVLNQHHVEDCWNRSDAFSSSQRLRACWSAYRAGLANMLGRGKSTDDVDFDEPSSVLSYVLANIPPYAIVYPTETYYYYQFQLGDRLVSGNVRLLDADRGKLHIGYFDTRQRREIRAATFTVEDGVEIQQLSDHKFRVRHEGRDVTFVLARQALRPADSLKLLEYEEAVTGILDESGYALTLVYNDIARAFYYVLNEDLPVTDTLVPVTGTDGRYLVGENSRFVFYQDSDYQRKLLVGVSSENVYANNYYDGPFDQVPPRLALKDKLEAAYPYVRMRGGIDEHGNFVALEHQRVAISPYQKYTELERLVEELEQEAAQALVKADLWLRLTYEFKRTFHRRFQALARSGAGSGAAAHAGSCLPIRQGWPANHWADNSYQWHEDHRQQNSSMWPANHDPTQSSTGDGGKTTALLLAINGSVTM
ncbi:MAG: hypothetical protein KAY37_16885 [Phycisphaerae bacterium]|nr:hypothetical protein [Phycisphaerae bacterium]